jgi:hypothetical protein
MERLAATYQFIKERLVLANKSCVQLDEQTRLATDASIKF